MTNHRVIVCNTDSQRLAVIEVSEHHGQTWVDCCRAAAYKWLRINGLPYRSCSIANGDYIVWTEGALK